MIWTARLAIMPHARQPLQSHHAGIRREAGRTGTLRDHVGCPAGATCGHYGHDHRCHGAGRATWRLLPEPALARQAGDGYSDGDEEFDRRERVDPERDGKAEGSVKWRGTGDLAREASVTRGNPAGC